VFAELDGRGGRAGVWWIALGLAALSLTALVLPGATRRPRGIEPALAATLLLAVVFAFAPIADALCPSQLAAVLSLADLEQCRDGRAGAPAALVPADAGLALVLACLAALALRSLARVDRAPIRAASDRALGLGLLVLIVAVLGPAYALGRGDLHGLALAQAAAADWGVVVAPLSAVAAIVAASYVAPETGGAGRLATATVIALAFLGGFSTPAQLLTAAGVGSVAAATIGLAALGFGLAALAWVHARASTGRRRAWCSAIAAAATLGLAASLLAAGSGADQLPLPHLAVVGGQLLVTAAKVIAVGALVALVSAALERRASSRRDAPGRGSADDAAARGSSTDDRPQAASAPWLLQAAMVLALLSLAVSALRPLPG
ncbi:MAG: hypothetical protein KC636_30430, partial [Myxococcales bacterium]|nr:hypothetical protein [Myxococcales bacterium]